MNKQNETHYGVVYIPDYRTTTSQCFLASLTLLKRKILEAASKTLHFHFQFFSASIMMHSTMILQSGE